MKEGNVVALRAIKANQQGRRMKGKSNKGGKRK
jgi:hypothetical protein